MTYNELLDSQKKYGTKENDILSKRDYDKVCEKVVLAPWWKVTIFDSLNPKVEKINDILYNIDIDGTKFSFLELKAIGAPVTLDEILNLGVSKCKYILFVGSAGSLNPDVKIVDFAIPKYSITGDGASRYLNKNLEDEFGKKQYTDQDLTEKLIKITNKYKDKVIIHNVPNFSVDTIFAQFGHIDYIKSLGAETIEMETAALFKSSKMCNIKATALFIISDNTIVNKSLYSGRNNEENEYRHYVRNNILPQIIFDLFKKI